MIYRRHETASLQLTGKLEGLAVIEGQQLVGCYRADLLFFINVYQCNSFTPNIKSELPASLAAVITLCKEANHLNQLQRAFALSRNRSKGLPSLVLACLHLPLFTNAPKEELLVN